jgi:hypothetical protein
MRRPLLLAILGAALLCAFFGVPQQPLVADTGGGMNGDTPKQPQMDVPPAVSSLTALQLQTDSVLSQKVEAFVLANSTLPGRTLYPAVLFFRDPIQTSTILRI